MGTVVSIENARMKRDDHPEENTNTEIDFSTGGWIKLHRSLLNHAVIGNAVVLQVFMFCLLKAASKNKDAIINNKVVKLCSGELITGRKSLADTLGLTERKVRTALKILVDLGIVTIKPTTRYSIISIVNWSQYQCNDQQTTNRRPASDQQTTTNKKYKNIKNNSVGIAGFDFWWDKYPSSRRSKKQHCLDKFLKCCEKLSDDQIEALTNKIAEDLDRRIAETEDFKFFPMSSTYVNGKRWEDGE